MLGSLFIVNKTGDVMIEKHWHGLVSRVAVEEFWKYVSASPRLEDVAPLIETPKYFFMHIIRNDVVFLAIVTTESPPLFILELLHRFADVLVDYLKVVKEETIRSNFLTVYQVLEEFVDNGFPLLTEPSVLHDIVPPSSFAGRFKQSITGKGGDAVVLPEGSMSTISWRKRGVKYSTNEIFFDVVEELDALVDTNGMVVNQEVRGKIACNCRLSGMPDILVTFVDPSILDSCSFHPCVRYTKFASDKCLSFVPPDGKFTLVEYRGAGTVHVPMYVKPQISFNEGGGRLHIMAGLKQASLDAKPLEKVQISVQLPSFAESVSLEATSGDFKFDIGSKNLVWTIGKMTAAKNPALNGTVHINISEKVPDTNLTVTAVFSMPGESMSGLKVDSVTVLAESYKAFKGVLYVSKSGNFQVRA